MIEEKSIEITHSPVEQTRGQGPRVPPIRNFSKTQLSFQGQPNPKNPYKSAIGSGFQSASKRVSIDNKVLYRNQSPEFNSLRKKVSQLSTHDNSNPGYTQHNSRLLDIQSTTQHSTILNAMEEGMVKNLNFQPTKRSNYERKHVSNLNLKRREKQESII